MREEANKIAIWIRKGAGQRNLKGTKKNKLVCTYSCIKNKLQNRKKNFKVYVNWEC